ncbi:MAG: glycosyl hydrolase family 28 protein [Kofleriaceae bacterium]
MTSFCRNVRAVAVACLIILLVSEAALAAGTYVRDESFNALPAGSTPGAPWSVVSTGGGSVSVLPVPFAADRSVRIQKLNASGASSLSTSFAERSGRVVVQARVMSRETAGFRGAPYIYGGAGVVASVAFQDGAIRAYVGGTSTVFQSFRPNVWYLIRVVVDTDADTFDLYIDGVRKARGLPLRGATSSVSRVAFFMDGVNKGTFYVDAVKVYTEAEYIGPPPAPVFDVRAFGARGDGTTKDTAAIQRAIDAAAGTGGSVLLRDGTFVSGTLLLRSDLTFYIAPSATLLGSANAADYPVQTPATGNTQLSNCKRALLYAPGTARLRLDGGGAIDGQGDRFGGAEGDRPMLIWAVLSSNFTAQNLYLKKGAMWSLVTMESDHVLINNINLQSDNITHDGIDVVDGFDVTVQNSAVRSGDDAMCLKTGVRRGLTSVTVRDSVFSASNGGSNGIKFGTASYGAFKDISIHDVYVKDVQYAAMAVESRQGADVDAIAFQRVELADTGAAFFVYLAQQAVTHPGGDVPKLGSMNDVSFTDIRGWTSAWPRSPAQGSLITGHIFNGQTYRITNLAFRNVDLTFSGGRTTIPRAPPEAQPNQYPESNMFGDLPAWAYFLRHVSGVTFTSVRSRLGRADVRPERALVDVSGVVSSP